MRRCRSCGRSLFGAASVCRSRRCPEYSHVWAGDQRQKLFRNLEAFGGDVFVGAVTAPGADVFPWDETSCAALDQHKHSGKLGCRVVGRCADPWNRQAAEQWRRLHRRAYQETVAEHGRGSVVLVARVWELQARGLLHVHPVVGAATPRQKAAAIAYLARLARLAASYGFGFVHHERRLLKAMPAQNAAAYLSSYFVKGRHGKAALWESVRSPSMPRSIVYVSTKLTMRTGCTMRRLRLRRALYYLWGANMTLNEVGFVATLLEVFPGAEILRCGHVHRGPPTCRRSAPAGKSAHGYEHA